MKTNCFEHVDTNNGTVTLRVSKFPVTVMKFCVSSVCNLGMTGAILCLLGQQLDFNPAWRQQTLSKHWYPSTKLHDITPKETLTTHTDVRKY
jgi:hypothetical protein